MEIGSNFELDFLDLKYTKDNIFNYLRRFNAIYVDSGRSACKVLNEILDLKTGVILLPSYICSSVIDVYKDMSIVFYKVDQNFSVNIQDLERKITSEVKAIYLMHYFGTIQNNECIDFLKRKKNEYNFIIIEDTTHCLLTNPNTIGDYCVCSLRKWFPIPDGGVLYSRYEIEKNFLQGIDKKLPSIVLDAMILKKWYIKENIQSNSIYREIFNEFEENLNKQKYIFQLSDISRSILECISVLDVTEKRKRNYLELKNNLHDSKLRNIFHSTDFVPLVYPIYIGDRDDFCNHLIKNHIYCAIHWPLKGTMLENYEDARNISNHIISLPIDQRYNSMHMRYLYKTIQNYLSGVKDGTDTG